MQFKREVGGGEMSERLAGEVGSRIRESAAMLGDADIRPALRTRLRAAHVRDVDTVVLEELGICRGQVRVDLATMRAKRRWRRRPDCRRGTGRC